MRTVPARPYPAASQRRPRGLVCTRPYPRDDDSPMSAASEVLAWLLYLGIPVAVCVAGGHAAAAGDATASAAAAGLTLWIVGVLTAVGCACYGHARRCALGRATVGFLWVLGQVIEGLPFGW